MQSFGIEQRKNGNYAYSENNKRESPQKRIYNFIDHLIYTPLALLVYIRWGMEYILPELSVCLSGFSKSIIRTFAFNIFTLAVLFC